MYIICHERDLQWGSIVIYPPPRPCFLLIILLSESLGIMITWLPLWTSVGINTYDLVVISVNSICVVAFSHQLKPRCSRLGYHPGAGYYVTMN